MELTDILYYCILIVSLFLAGLDHTPAQEFIFTIDTINSSYLD